MTEQEALLILNAVPGLGSVRIRQLRERNGSFQSIVADKWAALSCPAGFDKAGEIINQIRLFPKEEFLRKESALIKEHGIRTITFLDDEYPPLLRQIYDFPLVLYVKGQLSKTDNSSIAMVGSRKASIYGITIAANLSGRLAERGITIVSGMARGIDTAAHQGALRVKGHTVAVLGNGLSFVYPRENKKLFDEIAASGAVISEFPMEVPPRGIHFPRRNRIISGLSSGIVVVEAALKSGALITADFALEQGREVYAVPGEISNPFAGGANHLIQQGAKLVTCVEDILEDIEGIKILTAAKVTPEDSPISLNDATSGHHASFKLSNEEEIIFHQLESHPMHIDRLVSLCGMAPAPAMSALLQLELKNLVRQLPGKMFQMVKL